MMKDEKKNRTRWLHLRLSEDEYKMLQKYFEESVCPKMSDFARKNLLRKPVILKYRNTALDDLMFELIKMRSELNPIGNNFNQAVKKLHTLSQISEFKLWILCYETDKKMLFSSIEEIKMAIKNLTEKWLQS
ncbi:plasmid mobilization relaxosome protein MobC [Flavobacterium sp. UGB4466]|uniref:plasmid mobilization protein n=1 Tax=Flavobacterium sp. UGB4466 TaxID=2730889 RepID=UPI001ED97FF2|nr:plasmid mobilization relaxosome protein MobC [Flavobacterium sp. UGB4466]